jgi:hypothetical protein
MARTTPLAGEGGFVPVFPSPPTIPATAPASRIAPDAPRVERIGTVRIIRGAEGWHGVTLRVCGPETGERCELALTAGDGRSITVAVFDEDEAVANWRNVGNHSGLPLLIEAADGTVSQPFPQLGRLALGPLRLRRRHALLAGRRPRFLTRRKTGRMPDRPVIHKAEALTD